MSLKITKAEFMGVSEEWLAGYEEAKAKLERTCKMHPTTIGNKRHTATIHEYECLSCECLVVTYACDEKPRYCPHCGSKVMDD